MAVDFEIKGGKELERNLARLGARIERNVKSSAERAAASKYRKEMMGVLPRDDEDDVHLYKSLKVKKSRRRNLHMVGVAGPAARYAHKLEYDKRGKFAQYNRLWARTFERMVPTMIQRMADKVRAGIAKHGR